MNHFNKILICMSLFVLLFSCKKDNKTSDENKETAIVHPVIGKWNVTTKDSPIASIEFTKGGDFIAVGNDDYEGGKIIPNSSGNNKLQYGRKSGFPSLIFGAFTITDNKIIAAGLGMIDITSVSSGNFSFSLTLEMNGVTIHLTATLAIETASPSTRTDLLCHSWIIDKVDVSPSITDSYIEYYKEEFGDNWQVELAKDWTEELRGRDVIFTKYGTCIMDIEDKDDDPMSFFWKWTDKKENAFYYSWDNWKEESWEDNIIKVLELTNERLVTDDTELILHMVRKK